MNKKVWDKVLNSKEKVEFEFSISERYCKISFWVFSIISLFFLFPILLLIFSNSKIIAFVLFALLIVFFWFVFIFYTKVSNVFSFTNKRILIHRGWLNTKIISVDYDKITDVIIIQPFIEKLLFKTGEMKINTAGTGSHEIVLRHISEPYEIKKKLDLIRK